MSIMKSENKKSWLYYAAIAALVVAELYLLHFLYKYINLQLNSDDASELVLAHLLAKQKRIITPDWYYSTEIRFLNTNLVYAFMFLLFPHRGWHGIRIGSLFILHVLLLLSICYLCRQSKHKECFPFIALALLMPFSADYYYVILEGAYYIPHIVISFVTIGIIFGVMRSKGWRRSLLMVLSMAIALLACMGGPRQLLILYLPMALCAVILSAFEVRGKGFREYRKLGGFVFSLAAVLNLAAGCIGYLINTKFLSKAYHFMVWNGLSYKAFDWNSFLTVLNGFLGTFGYVSGPIGEYTATNLIAGIVFLMTVIAIVYAFKNRAVVSEEYFLLAAYYVCAVVIFLLLYSMTDMAYLSRYNVPVAVISYVLIAMWIAEKPWTTGRKDSIFAMYAGLCLLSGILSYHFMLASFSETDFSNENEKVSQVVLNKGYLTGYATFWHANIITEFSNGRVDMYDFGGNANQDLDLSECRNVNDTYKWLQLVSHDTKKPEGKVFLLLSANEYDTCVWKEELTDDSLIYYSDNLRAYGFDSWNDMQRTLGNGE